MAPSCDPRQRPELAVVEREGLGDQSPDALGDGPRGAPPSGGQHVVSAGLPLAVQRLECRGAELVTERPKSIEVSDRERREVAPVDRASGDEVPAEVGRPRGSRPWRLLQVTREYGFARGQAPSHGGTHRQDGPCLQPAKRPGDRAELLETPAALIGDEIQEVHDGRVSGHRNGQLVRKVPGGRRASRRAAAKTCCGKWTGGPQIVRRTAQPCPARSRTTPPRRGRARHPAP